MAIILVVGILLGGGVGAFVAGPMLAKPVAVPAAASADAPEPQDARGGRRDAPPVLFVIDNLVLNPAGSGGTRFLMVSAALDLRDSKVLDQLRTREPEVRDVLLGVLGQKTVEELADIRGREALKDDIRKVVEQLVAPGSVRQVYLPQFVIQ